MLTLIISFFIIALLYSTVGFGGGSSYIAILADSGVSYLLIPKISLMCNLLVVAGGCYHYIKEGHFNKKLIFPFVISSVPMAFLGGSFPLSEKSFFILLTISLILCGFRILFLPDRNVETIKSPGIFLSVIVGSLLGLLSGMVGIGGGIFLSPILINMGWARSKDAAAVASMFILLNSLAGLSGQFIKDGTMPETSMILPLFAAVIVGGQIGSRIGTHTKVSYNLIQKGTGILTLFISFRLLMKTFG